MSMPFPPPNPGDPFRPTYPGPPPAPLGDRPPGLPQARYVVPRDPDLRPTNVTVAGWITIVLSAISMVAGVIAAVGAPWLIDRVRDHPNDFDLNADQVRQLDDATTGVVVAAIILVLIAVFSATLGVLVLKRQNWARITLVVMSGITIVVGLIGFFTLLVGGLWAAGGVAVVILLFVGDANAWFSRTPPRRPPSYQPNPPYQPSWPPPPTSRQP